MRNYRLIALNLIWQVIILEGKFNYEIMNIKIALTYNLTLAMLPQHTRTQTSIRIHDHNQRSVPRLPVEDISESLLLLVETLCGQISGGVHIQNVRQ